MRRPGSLPWLVHDLTRRGLTAWALSTVLLGFYLGLYLPAETKQVLTWLGVARPTVPCMQLHALAASADMRLRAPGLGVFLGCALLGVVGVLGRAYAFRIDEGLASLTAEHRRAAMAFGTRLVGLAVGTLYTSYFFANVLEPVERHGRRLLPPPGISWPLWVLVPSSVVCVGGVLAGLWGVWCARGDRGAMLRRASLPLAFAFAGLLLLLYGTHAFDPAHPLPEGTRSLTAFGQRFYRTMDSKWGLYGLLYTMAVTVGGGFVLGRYGHDRYQVVRTLCVMVVQGSFGFSVPVLLGMFQQPERYLTYFWPLKIDAFYPDVILRDPAPFVLWSFLGSLVLVPAMGLFFGKRWYCSWVCGCGGLANTAGDAWRHLSDPSVRAWRFERVAIHTVLVVAVLTTVFVVLSAFMAPGAQGAGVWWPGHGPVHTWRFAPQAAPSVVAWAGRLRYYYGVVVVSVLSGAVGVGLYPLGGTRVWCRYFCPMAALLGLVQKSGRYRIRVKEDMCISCGLCTNACEMGIDVRAYAQANQSFTRASCVGCGLCATVCPRGVLRLEQRAPHELQVPRRGALVPLRLHKDA